MMKRAVLAIMGAASIIGLAGCNQSEADAPTDSATPVLVKGVSITDPRLVLAPVSGNPAAVYFVLSYVGAAGVTLSSVTVEGAGMSMIHQTAERDGAMTMMEAGPIALSTGVPVTFAPGGMHVMAMQPSEAWKPGETVTVTLTLSDGTTQAFPAEIRAAGEER